MNVIFTCGGTAGHVNPALALAGFLRERDPKTRILFVGAERGLERDLIAHTPYPFRTVNISSFHRSLRPKELRHNLVSVRNLMHAKREADATTMEEKNADLFASVLLLPREGVYAMLSTDEILQHDVKLATILRIEQLFQVSRSMLLIRLKDIGVISENKRQELQMIPVKESAMNYGYDKSLYESGNDGVFIGDFGEKARLLFETGKISEGHYTELLNMISNGREKD